MNIQPMKNCLAILMLALSEALFAAPLETVLVLIDKPSEQALGAYADERDALAIGIVKLEALGAKEVLLKFFLDLPQTKHQNELLKAALTKLPVTLQARFDDNETDANQLLPKHRLGFQYHIMPSAMHGTSGWLPISDFSKHANKVGFIDSINPAFLIETYKQHKVGSLYFHALESIYGATFVVRNQKLYLDGKQIPLNQKGELFYTWLPLQKPTYVSYLDLVKDDALAEKIRGNYVIFGYDGKDIHQLDTPSGPMNAHLAFYHSLLSIIASIEKTPEKPSKP